MNDGNLTNEELVRAVDNDPVATPREREMANRMDELALEIEMLNKLLEDKDDAGSED